MGTIQHDVVIAVSSYRHEKAQEAFAEVCAKAAFTQDTWPGNYPFLRLFCQGDGVANGIKTFVMLPDGSKEGWETSTEADILREFFIARMREANCEIAYVSFGETGNRLIVNGEQA